MTDDTGQRLRAAVRREGDDLVGLCQRLIAARSENPPGDTRAAAEVVAAYLDDARISYRIVAPRHDMPNLVATFEGTRPGPHLILNGHLDTFPAGDPQRWDDADPFSGAVRDGKIVGRGAADMKGGLAALLTAFRALADERASLPGSVTLTVVSDEETFGPWGARYLVENEPEVIGDALLNAEPSSPTLLRCGEKGFVWLAIHARTGGAHGGMTHMSANAIRIVAGLTEELRELERIQEPVPTATQRVISDAREVIDDALGRGSSDALTRVTLNVGTFHGGLKVNMVAPSATAELDIRLPPGLRSGSIMARVEQIVARQPQASVELINASEPTFSDPREPIFEAMLSAARDVRGAAPVLTVSAPATDSRLWRARGIPAAVYGPRPHSVGAPNEYITVDDLLVVCQTFAVGAQSYLTRGASQVRGGA